MIEAGKPVETEPCFFVRVIYGKTSHLTWRLIGKYRLQEEL